jgi:hypothetical protein
MEIHIKPVIVKLVDIFHPNIGILFPACPKDVKVAQVQNNFVPIYLLFST